MMHAAYVEGTYHCYETFDGIHKRFLGCQHMYPKSQIAHAEGTYVSPRRSGEAVTPTPSAPLPGLGQLTASPEPLGWLDQPDPPRP